MKPRMASFFSLSTLALLALAGCSSLPARYNDASADRPCTSGIRQRVQTGNLVYTVSEDFSGAHPAMTPTGNFQTTAEYDVEQGARCK